MKFFQTTILNDVWTIYLADDTDVVSMEEEDAAHVDLGTKEVFIRENYLNLENVRHEMFHLYTKYCFIGSATLNQDQMEEVACELFANRGPEMLAKAEEIHVKLMELKYARES